MKNEKDLTERKQNKKKVHTGAAVFLGVTLEQKAKQQTDQRSWTVQEEWGNQDRQGRLFELCSYSQELELWEVAEVLRRTGRRRRRREAAELTGRKVSAESYW